MSSSFFDEYMADMEYSGLPNVTMPRTDSSDDILSLGNEASSDLQQYLDKEPFAGSNSVGSTVSPYWLQQSHFSAGSNPESSDGPSSVISGPVDDDLASQDLTRSVSTDADAQNTDGSIGSPFTKDAAREPLKEELTDEVALPPVERASQPLSPKKKRKRPAPGNDDTIRRQKFLERNRVAASKCRRKKKEAEKEMETLCRQLAVDRDNHQREVARLSAELKHMHTILLSHGSCNIADINRYIAAGPKQFDTNAVLDDSPSKNTLFEARSPEAAQPSRGQQQCFAIPEPRGFQSMPVYPPMPLQHQQHTLHTAPIPVNQHMPPTYQSMACQAISPNNSPQLYGGDFMLQSADRHLRNASQSSSLTSMTSFSSPSTSYLDNRRNSSVTSVGSFDAASLSPLFSDFQDPPSIPRREPGMDLGYDHIPDSIFENN